VRYAIITYGSRGDVQPYIVLALGLMNRGHEVTLLAPENFKDFVEDYGVPFYPLHGNSEELLYTPECLRFLKTGNTFSLMLYMQKAGRKIQPLINRDMLAGSLDADILIASVLCIVWVRSIAEKLNKRWGIVQLNPPTMPTEKFPFAGLAFFNSPRYNLFTYRLLWFLHWQLIKKDVNKFRISLGLSPVKISLLDKMSHENIFNLYAFSPQLIARPDDWDSNIDITGFLTLSAESRETHEMDVIPEDLKQWLQEGKKPIYIGFGSMPVPNAELFGVILNEIISGTNQRIIFCKGWSAISGLPMHSNLFTVNYINHEWLFPQCSAAVIHGGIGTIAAVLKAKIPVIIVSVFADQPWWGKIIEDKNLGVHIPFKKLTTQKLLKAIDATQTPEMRKSVSETGEKINNEDGLKRSLDAIENYFV
jgi:sterol 3beta-glucosyltransferase